MNKRSIFLISGAITATIILIILLIPILFRGKIVSRVKLMANETMLAKLDFKEVDVSLFRSFPQLDVRIKELTISGINEFEGKNLVQIETLSTSLSLSSLWKSDGLILSEITLNYPQFNLLVSPAGKANWDISKPSNATTSTDSKKPINIELKKIQLINSTLTYRDEEAGLTAGFKSGNFGLYGFLRGNDTKLNFNGQADSILLDNRGKTLVSGMKLSGEGELQADFDQMSFKFLANKFLVNQLPLELQGTFVAGEKSDQYDITFQSKVASLEKLISFLPNPLQKNLKTYQKSGSLTFSGLMKGTYSKETFPAFHADLKLTDGKLKYPNKPNEINKIELVATLHKPQGSLDSLRIEISKLNANIAGHPFISGFKVVTPVSNPFLSGDVVGEADFSTLRQTIPLDSMDLAGIIRTNIHFSGPYSAIDSGDYDKFQTKGNVTLNDFSFQSASFPERVGIQRGAFEFNSKEVRITDTKGKLGVSDFLVNGSLSNYWAWILKNETLTGNIKLKSDLLDITQLMNGGTQTKDSAVHSETYVIPDKIDLTVQTDVAKMLYNRMEITGTTGKLMIKEQKMNLDQLSMGLLKGRLVLSGTYTGKEKSPADFNFNMDMTDIDLPTAYRSLALVRHLLPIAGSSRGAFFSSLSLNGTLGKDYSPNFSTLNGKGQIALKNLELVGNNLFSEIGKYFRKDLFTNVKVNDFTGNITVTNGALAISPFTTKVANQEVTVSGNQSLALDLNYQLNFKVNKSDLSQDVTGFIGLVPGTENIEKYPIRVDVVGKIAKPEVKVDISEAKDLVAKEFSKKAKNSLKDVVKKFGLEGLFK